MKLNRKYFKRTIAIIMITILTCSYVQKGEISIVKDKSSANAGDTGNYETLESTTIYGNKNYKYNIIDGKSGKEIQLVKYVGAYTNVTIPSKIQGYPVTSILEDAFSFPNSLINIIIPESVTSIEDHAFLDCNSLTNIIVNDGNSKYCDKDGILFSKDEKTIVCYPHGKSEKEYTIPESVTSIGNRAFSYCNRLTSITIPESVTSIGDNAFEGCDSLTSITIPGSVTSIGDSAFFDCNSLTNITIPESVTSIGDYAFYSCDRLTSITIPESVTSIGNRAFSYCNRLTSIIVNDGNSKYCDKDGILFSKDEKTIVCYPNGKSEKEYTIPESVTSIGDSAFLNCDSLTSITIPGSVTSIGNGAFSYCDSLTSITIPKSVTNIGEDAFSYCDSLTSITIPESVTSIGDNAFRYCDSLTSIEVNNGNSKYCDKDGILFSKDEKTIVCYPKGKSGKEYTIPESVTSIGRYAFAGCNSLTSITIPESVTSIGYGAFAGCNSLTSITIPESVTSIGRYAFAGCDSLTSITIPESVTSIGDYAFESCDSLTSITIPKSVTSIGNYAFEGCARLTNITILGSITSIGDGVFHNCVYLTSITIPESVTSIGFWAFNNCARLTSIIIPESVTSIGDNAFGCCASLNEIIIPNSVNHIGNGVFYECNTTIRCSYSKFLNLFCLEDDVYNSYCADELEFEFDDVAPEFSLTCEPTDTGTVLIVDAKDTNNMGNVIKDGISAYSFNNGESWIVNNMQGIKEKDFEVTINVKDRIGNINKKKFIIEDGMVAQIDETSNTASIIGCISNLDTITIPSHIGDYTVNVVADGALQNVVASTIVTEEESQIVYWGSNNIGANTTTVNISTQTDLHIADGAFTLQNQTLDSVTVLTSENLDIGERLFGDGGQVGRLTFTVGKIYSALDNSLQGVTVEELDIPEFSMKVTTPNNAKKLKKGDWICYTITPIKELASEPTIDSETKATMEFFDSTDRAASYRTGEGTVEVSISKEKVEFKYIIQDKDYGIPRFNRFIYYHFIDKASGESVEQSVETFCRDIRADGTTPQILSGNQRSGNLLEIITEDEHGRIKEYAIAKTQDNEDLNWNKISGNLIEDNITKKESLNIVCEANLKQDIYIYVKDQCGNISAPYKLNVDTTLPELTKIKVNGKQDTDVYVKKVDNIILDLFFNKEVILDDFEVTGTINGKSVTFKNKQCENSLDNNFHTQYEYNVQDENGIMKIKLNGSLKDKYEQENTFNNNTIDDWWSNYIVIDNEAPKISVNIEKNVLTINATDNVSLQSNIIKYALSTNSETPSEGWKEENKFNINSDGTYYAFAMDTAGNIGKNNPIIIDTTPPEIDRVDTQGSKIIINPKDEADVAKYGISKDQYCNNAVWQDKGEFRVKDGMYYVFVKDLAGNYSMWKEQIIIDTTPPNLLKAILNKNTQTITIKATDNIGKIQYGISEGEVVPSTWQKENVFTVENDGTYYAYAKDDKGNISTGYKVVLDTNPPTIEFELENSKETYKPGDEIIIKAIPPSKKIINGWEKNFKIIIGSYVMNVTSKNSKIEEDNTCTITLKIPQMLIGEKIKVKYGLVKNNQIILDQYQNKYKLPEKLEDRIIGEINVSKHVNEQDKAKSFMLFSMEESNSREVVDEVPMPENMPTTNEPLRTIKKISEKPVEEQSELKDIEREDVIVVELPNKEEEQDEEQLTKVEEQSNIEISKDPNLTIQTEQITQELEKETKQQEEEKAILDNNEVREVKTEEDIEEVKTEENIEEVKENKTQENEEETKEILDERKEPIIQAETNIQTEEEIKEQNPRKENNKLTEEIIKENSLEEKTEEKEQEEINYKEEENISEAKIELLELEEETIEIEETEEKESYIYMPAQADINFLMERVNKKALKGTTVYSQKEGALGTGSKIQLINEQGEEVKSYVVVIKGDANGDGNITVADIIIANAMRLNTNKEINKPLMKSTDIAPEKGKIDIMDIIHLNALRLALIKK